MKDADSRVWTRLQHSPAEKAKAGVNWDGLSRRESQLLLACARGRMRAKNGVRWGPVVEAAQRHRIAPMMAAQLDPAVVPEAARCRLAELVEKTRQRDQAARQALAAIAAEAQRRAVPLLVFKGPLLSDSCYSPPELRTYYDLDLLVPRKDLESAERLMAELGYAIPPLKSTDLFWMMGTRPTPVALEYFSPEETRELWLANHFHFPFAPAGSETGVRVDLHWALFRMAQLHLPTREFWQRAQPIEIAGHQAWTFCPADNLLYLCLHTGTDTYQRMRLIKLVDIVRVAERLTESEWNEIAERSSRYQVEKIFLLALWLAYRTAGRQLPEPARRMNRSLLRLGLLGATLSPRAMLSCSSPWADAAWDWALGQAGLPLVRRALDNAARRWVKRLVR